MQENYRPPSDLGYGIPMSDNIYCVNPSRPLPKYLYHVSRVRIELPYYYTYIMYFGWELTCHTITHINWQSDTLVNFYRPIFIYSVSCIIGQNWFQLDLSAKIQHVLFFSADSRPISAKLVPVIVEAQIVFCWCTYTVALKPVHYIVLWHLLRALVWTVLYVYWLWR